MEGWHPEMTNPLWEQVRNITGILRNAAAGMDTFNLARGGQAHNVPGLWVSGDFFNVLGVPLSWAACSLRKTTARVADRLLQSLVMRFAARTRREASAIGKKITLGGYPVSDRRTPASFFGLEMGRASMWRCRLAPGDS
jgi:hypothetical protein